MENLEEILKKTQTRASTSKADTGTWSSGKADSDGHLTDSTCAYCGGTRFVYPLLPSGYPDYSRVMPCRCTYDELHEDKISRLQRLSNMSSLVRLTFENLVPEGKHKGKTSQQRFTRAYEAAKTFAVNPEGWLVLVGPTGSGKTHLACAIANHRLSLSQPAFYTGAADLLDHLRSTFNADTDVLYDDLFERVKNVPLLVLDDLTMAVTTPWAKGRLEQLLNYRFNGRLPMVITSDVPIEEIENDMRAHLADEEFCHVFLLRENISTPLDRIGSLDLELLKNMSFENFNHKRLNLSLEKRQNLEQALKIAENYAESPQGWLVFQGVNGCGKTHLSAAIANKLRQDGKTALFIVVTDLLDHLRSAFGPDSNVSYDDLFEKIKRAEVLILDDFGEQSSTPWAQEKMYQLINYRYNARLATVITTCQSLDEIEVRISSRMVDPSLSLVFYIMAPDYRGDLKASRSVKKSQRAYD